MDPAIFYELSLSRFKGVQSQTISIPAQGVTLLNGVSGIGKTTLLEALSFVFYDGARNTCYPRSDRNSKKKCDPTAVQLTFPNGLKIYRQRRPNLLRVIGPGIDLMDESAQLFLNQQFGSLSSWLSGGYLKQDNFCGFLSMTAPEKLSFLQELSLPDSFERLLNRATEKLQSSQRDLQAAENDVRVYQGLYLRIYQQASPEVIQGQAWTPEEIQSYQNTYSVPPNLEMKSFLNQLQMNVTQHFRNNIEKKRTELSQAQIRLTQYQETDKQRKILEERLNVLQKSRESLKDVENGSELISKLEMEIEQLVEQISYAQTSERKSQLLAAKTEIQKRLTAIPFSEKSNYTFEQISRFEQILNGPNLDSLDTTLTQIQEARVYQKLFSQDQHRKQLLAQKENFEKLLETYPSSSVQEKIQELDRHIWLAQLQQQKLTCPQCESAVYLENGSLVQYPTEASSDHNLSHLHSEKTRLSEIQRRFQERSSLEKSLQDVQIQLSKIPEVNLPSEAPPYANHQSLDVFENQIQEKRKLRSEVPDIDCSTEKQKIQAEMDRNRLSHDLNSITQELNSLQSNPSNLNESNNPIFECERLRDQKKSELTQLRQKIHQRESVSAQMDQIQSQLDQMNFSSEEISLESLNQNLLEIQAQISKFDQELSEILSQIQIQSQLSELIELYQKHEASLKIHTEITQRIGYFQKIKSTLITAEYVIMDSVLNQINLVIGDILRMLFNEPITITLRSLRQLKTGDQIKPEINLEIVYGGSEFNSLNELSGGEKSRASLALVIAFARMGKNPFLLLDECLSSLDVVNKELAISAIRKYLGDKIVLAVNHDTTEGVYDSVIRLS